MSKPALSEEEALALSHQSYDKNTDDIKLMHTMYRIKDPKRTIEFYSKVLGLSLIFKIDFPEWKFSLYFLANEDPKEIPKDFLAREAWATTRRPVLELTHNWGTEDDPNFKYNPGAHNSLIEGYGHIGVMVPDVDKACERFEELNVDIIKKPHEGRMRDIAFIRDPDGYVIEIFPDRRLRLKNHL